MKSWRCCNRWRTCWFRSNQKWELLTDGFGLIKDKSLEYKVNTIYKQLILKCAENLIEEEQKVLLKALWKSAVPSEFLVHTWQLLLNQLSTRVALEQHGVMTFNQGPSCVFCYRTDEEIEHLFFCCSVPRLVWQYFKQHAAVSKGAKQKNCST